MEIGALTDLVYQIEVYRHDLGWFATCDNPKICILRNEPEDTIAEMAAAVHYHRSKNTY